MVEQINFKHIKFDLNGKSQVFCTHLSHICRIMYDVFQIRISLQIRSAIVICFCWNWNSAGSKYIIEIYVASARPHRSTLLLIQGDSIHVVDNRLAKRWGTSINGVIFYTILEYLSLVKFLSIKIRPYETSRDL